MEFPEIKPETFLQSWIVPVIGILTTVYIFLTWHFGYWKRQGVKGDKPWPFFGTMNNPFIVPFDVQDWKMYQKYGRVFGIFEGRNPCLVVGDPNLVKTIFVKDFSAFRNRRFFPVAERDKIVKKFMSIMKDDEWKDLRNTVTPTFTTGKIKQMVSLINECAEVMVNELNQYADNNLPFDTRKCVSSFSMDVIASCAFGMKIDYKNDPTSEYTKHARKMFNSPPKSFYLAYLLPKIIEFLPAILPRDSINYFENFLNNVISVRKQEKSPRTDFLQLLIEACKQSEETIKNAANNNKENSKFVMTHEHVVAQAMLILLAGFETTAITLTFALYSIVQHQDIQEKLIQEIDQVLKKHGGVISYESIAEMSYVDMVISETLRMYPPAPRIERTCETDNYKLDGIVLKKGMVIAIPVYSMHHDEEFFPNPSEFDPERFSPENISLIKPYTYLPFGSGPRNCIGMRFALMEAKIALVSILRNFRVKTCPETQIPYKRQVETVLLLQPEGLKLMLDKRTDVL